MIHLKWSIFYEFNSSLSLFKSSSIVSFSLLIGSYLAQPTRLFTTNEWIRLFIGFGHRGKNKLFSDFVFRNLEERSFAFGKADSDRDRSRLWRFESVEQDVDFEIELPSIGGHKIRVKKRSFILVTSKNVRIFKRFEKGTQMSEYFVELKYLIS